MDKKTLEEQFQQIISEHPELLPDAVQILTDLLAAQEAEEQGSQAPAPKDSEEEVLDIITLTAMMDDAVQNHDKEWRPTAEAFCKSQGIDKQSILGGLYTGFVVGVFATMQRLYEVDPRFRDYFDNM